MDQHSLCMLYVPCPDLSTAQNISRSLIAEELAVCVNIHGPTESFYLWEGKLEHSKELILFVKTKKSTKSQCELRIKESHPFEIPLIAEIPVNSINSEYQDWMEQHGQK